MSTFPPLQPGVAIVDKHGAPTQFFLSWLNQVSTGVSNSSGASMPTPPPVEVAADYQGNISSGQLPKKVQVQRFLNGDDVSAKCRWFLSTVSGSITATIDQAGLITITALGSTSVLQAKSVRDGITLTCDVAVHKDLGGIPASTTGTDTTSTLSSINSAVYAIIAGPLSLTVGATGTVTLSAPLTVNTSAATPSGDFPVWGKWQWYNGTSWVDVAAEVESNPDATVTSTRYDHEDTDGSLTVNTSKAGLTPGTTAQFQLLARNDSGTRTMYFSGTASATTS